MSISSDEIKALEVTHKRVAVVRSKHDDWEVVYRRPTRQEYKRFRAMAQSNPDAQEQLCRSIVVFPSKEAFDALLEDWPGIPEASAKAIMDLTGMQSKEDVGES